MAAEAKSCFYITPPEGEVGDPITVWGAIDEVELSAGLTPNAVQMRVPYHEYTKISSNWERTGTLKLFLSDEATADVELANWSIDMVADSRVGVAVGQAQSLVQEKTLTLTDRRWELLDGRGGALWEGLINSANPDGSGVANVGNSFDGTTPSLKTLIVTALTRMQYASGLSAIANGVVDEYLTANGGTWPVPRDVKWDGVPLVAELERLLALAECVFLVRADGAYDVKLICQGDYPTISATELPSAAMLFRTTRSSTVIVTSAPSRIINQASLAGITTDTFAYAAYGTDNKLAPVNAIDYIVAKYSGDAEAAVRDGFAKLNEAEKRLAERDLFRLIQMTAVAAKGRLPVLTGNVVSVYNETDNTWSRTGPRLTYKGFIERDGGVAQATEARDFELTLRDARQGLFHSNELIGRLDVAFSPSKPYSHFKAFTSADGSEAFSVTFAHELTAGEVEGRKRHAEFFTRGWKIDINGAITALTDEELDTALADGETASTRIVCCPELQEYQVDHVSQNGAALVAEAQAIAYKLLKQPRSARVHRYAGLVSVSPSGVIPRVKWDLRSGITEVEEQTWFLPSSQPLQVRAGRIAAGKASSAALSAAASPEAGNRGRRDWTELAPPQNGQGALAGSVGRSIIHVGWAIATADWTEGDPPRVTAKPIDGAVPNVLADALNVSDPAIAATDVVLAWDADNHRWSGTVTTTGETPQTITLLLVYDGNADKWYLSQSGGGNGDFWWDFASTDDSNPSGTYVAHGNATNAPTLAWKTGEQITVLLPRTLAQDPDVKSGAVLAYATTSTGEHVCVTDYMEGRTLELRRFSSGEPAVYAAAVQIYDLSGEAWISKKVSFATSDPATRGVSVSASGGDPNGDISISVTHAPASNAIPANTGSTMIGDAWIALGNVDNDGLLVDGMGHWWTEDVDDETYIVARHNAPQASNSQVNLDVAAQILDAGGGAMKLRISAKKVDIDAKGHVRGQGDATTVDVALTLVTIGGTDYYVLNVP